jgi:hypothetical protein
MNNSYSNSIFHLADLIRSEYNNNNVIDSLTSITVAKALAPNRSFSNVNDLNKIIEEYYPELRYEGELSSEFINNFNKLNLDYRMLSTFLTQYFYKKYNNIEGFDLSPEISKKLANLIKLPHNGDVACLNCSGIYLLKEALLQNKFEGNVHLFCQNKIALRIAFLSLYPENKNIFLHGCLETFGLNHSKKFDFIYSLLPLGLRKKDTPTEVDISQVRNMLKDNGQFSFIVGGGFLFRRDKMQTRKMILGNFNIDLILSCRSIFWKHPGIEGAMIVLNKSAKNEASVFVAKVDLLEDNSFEDIDLIIRAYADHKTGKVVQNVLPLMNQINKGDLKKDFVVNRFDPKLLNRRKCLTEKYELRPLSDICEIIYETKNYGSEDYLSQKSDSSVPYIRVQDLKNGKVNLSSAKEVERKSNLKFLTQPEDLLFSRNGTIGKVALIDSDSSSSLPSKSLVILRPHKDLVDSEFLHLALQSEYVVGQVMKHTVGTTIPHLTITNLRSIEIPLPPLVEQKRAAHKINRLQTELTQLKSEVNELESKLQSEIKNLF